LWSQNGDIVLRPHASVPDGAFELETIPTIHFAVDSLTYVLFFPFGEGGWSEGMRYIGDRGALAAANAAQNAALDAEALNDGEIDLPERTRVRWKVSLLQYSRSRIQDRVTPATQGQGQEIGELIFNPLMRGGRLFQQYITDVYCRIEDQRLLWFILNQTKIRSDLYSVSDRFEIFDYFHRIRSRIGVRLTL
jgi:hypothetical protein